MRLVNLPALRRRHFETLSHSLLSVLHAVTVRRRPDVAVVFNAANAPLLPLLKAARVPMAVHVDGLEWKRGKWAGAGAKYYRWAEKRSVHMADALIADARGIADHIREAHGRESIYIPYGAPLVAPGSHRLADLGLDPHGYHLVVARFAPENHVREIVSGFVASSAKAALIVVGSAPYDDDVHRRGPRGRATGTTGSGCWAASGTRSCSTSCTPTRCPTSTATRWAAPTRRCCGPWAPALRSPPTTRSSTARWSTGTRGTSPTRSTWRSP